MKYELDKYTENNKYITISISSITMMTRMNTVKEYIYKILYYKWGNNFNIGIYEHREVFGLRGN